MANFIRHGVCFALLVNCGGCATSPRPHASEQDFSGTISSACGSTDGVASFMSLRARKSSHDFLRVFLDGLGPVGLDGTIQTAPNSDSPKLTINSCASDDSSSCTIETNATTDGSITILKSNHNYLEGTLRFKRGNNTWDEASFRAKIVPPSRHTICG